MAERDVAACARAENGLVCSLWQNGHFTDASQWSDSFGWGDFAAYHGASAAMATPDLDGDGRSDACLQGRDGLSCAVRVAPAQFASILVQSPLAADGFGDWSAAARIKFPDVDGDGLADACARGVDGIFCARGLGGGAFAPLTRWAGAPFRNIDGSGAPDHYRTLRFGDLDGDGRADVCIATATGIACALARHGHFADATDWSHRFVAGITWELVDLDGDGRGDVCGVADGALACARSDGTRFVDDGAALPIAPGTTVRFADLNGDGKSDACMFDAAGLDCALSDGHSFAPSSSWHRSTADAPAAMSSWLVDVDGDRRADLCRRTSAGLGCALSDGSRFVPPIATQSVFGDDSTVDRDLDLGAISIGRHFAFDARVGNRTAVENRHTGALKWWIPYPQWSIAHEVEAYTDKLSYAGGDQVAVMLSTAKAGDEVTWTLYRTGWYQGRGARRILAGHVRGDPQPLPPAATGTGEPVRAGWRPTFHLPLPGDAVSGVYALRLDSAATGKSSFVTFVVREDERVSDLLFQRADFTDEAYNAWDGTTNTSSLYNGARWVSFERPLRSVDALGVFSYSSGYFVYEYPMVRWLESQGYDVAYVSDADLQGDAAALKRAGSLLVVGHDEYWSLQKRDAVEHARDAGLNIGFFGADSVDARIRFHPADPRSFARTISDDDGHEDVYALFPIDPRKPPHDNPSDTLTGAHYIGWCAGAFAECKGDPSGKLRVADDADVIAGAHPIFRGLDGTTAPLPRVLGYEYESTVADLSTLPFTLRVLAQAANVRLGGAVPTMVAYRAASGALVANVGSMHWAHALDPWTGRAAFRQSGGERDCGAGESDCFVRPPSPAAQITANILLDFGAVPATPSPSLALSSGRVWP